MPPVRCGGQYKFGLVHASEGLAHSKKEMTEWPRAHRLVSSSTSYVILAELSLGGHRDYDICGKPTSDAGNRRKRAVRNR
jgi:hypothetical protein